MATDTRRGRNGLAMFGCAVVAAAAALVASSVAIASPGDVKTIAVPTASCVGQPDGAPCDDANCCTTGDVCSGEVCGGLPIECNDYNPCTDEHCDPATCTCVYFTRDCSDDDPCTTDTCNPTTGWCAYTPNNSSCDDGNFCTEDDRCTTACGEYTPGCGVGSCIEGRYCDDCSCAAPCEGPGQPGNPSCDCCAVRSCGEVTPGCGIGECLNGSYCDECQCYAPWSQISQTCCATAPCAGVDLSDDGNPCTLDTCDVATGMVVHEPYPDGTPCDDGKACTITDVCLGGTCQGAVNCPRDQQCDEAGNCASTRCLDAPVRCDDHDDCTADTCTPGNGKCRHRPVCNKPTP